MGTGHRASPCRHCRRPLDPFGRCRRRTCPAFRELWSGDWQACLLTNLRDLDDVALVTVTAPGTDHGLVWDESSCTHSPQERCSGKLGCRVVASVASRWNETAEAEFARLHRAAVGRLRRRFGNGSIVAAKAWEMQARGVMHLHLVVPYAPGRERARADVYAATLKEIGPRYGFGYSDLRAPRNAHHGGLVAASYVAKYVGKATAEASAQVKRPAYVGAFLTARTGVTMRALRWRRYLAHKLQVALVPLPDLRPLIALFTAFPSLELVPEPARGP